MDETVLFDTKEIGKILRKMGDDAADMTPTMQVVAEGLVADVNDRWDSAGNGTWEDLAPSTIAKRRGTSYEILKDTGRAAQSVNAIAGPDWAEASSDVDYLKYHVGDNPRTVIPKRDPFELGPDSIDRAQQTILDALAQLGSK